MYVFATLVGYCLQHFIEPEFSQLKLNKLRVLEVDFTFYSLTYLGYYEQYSTSTLLSFCVCFFFHRPFFRLYILAPWWKFFAAFYKT